MPQHELIGNWRLMSLQFEFSGSDERMDMYGRDPQGYLMIAEGGRMMVIVTSPDRSLLAGKGDEAALFRSMMGYAGSYRVEGNDLFVSIPDVAWHPSWLGTDQGRHYRIDGDILSIRTAEVTHPMFKERLGRGVLKWRRENGPGFNS